MRPIAASAPSTSRADARNARAQRSVWKPVVHDAIDEQIAWATYSGSTRTELGPQNGVWVKCTTCRSGRASLSIWGTSVSW